MIDTKNAPQGSGGFLDILGSVSGKLPPRQPEPLSVLEDLGVDLSSMDRRTDAPLTADERSTARWEVASGMLMEAARFDRRGNVSLPQAAAAYVDAGAQSVLGERVGGLAGGLFTSLTTLMEFPGRIGNYAFRQVVGEDFPEWFDATYESAFGAPPPAAVRFIAGGNVSGQAVTDDAMRQRQSVMRPDATPSEIEAGVSGDNMWRDVGAAMGDVGQMVLFALATPATGGAAAPAAAASAGRAASVASRLLRPMGVALKNKGNHAFMAYQGGRMGMSMGNDYREFIERENEAIERYNGAIERLGLAEAYGTVEPVDYSQAKELGLFAASATMTAATELIGNGFSIGAAQLIRRRLAGDLATKAMQRGIRGALQGVRAGASQTVKVGGMEAVEEAIENFGQSLIRSTFDYSIDGGFAAAARPGGRFSPLEVLRGAADDMLYDGAVAFIATAPLGYAAGRARFSRRRRIHEAFEAAHLRDRLAESQTGRAEASVDLAASRAVGNAIAGEADADVLNEVVRQMRKRIPEIGSATAENITDPEWVDRFVQEFPLVAAEIAEGRLPSRSGLEWLTGAARDGVVPNSSARAAFHQMVKDRVRRMMPEYMAGWYDRSIAEVASWRQRLADLGDRSDEEAVLIRAQASQRLEFIRMVMGRMKDAWSRGEAVSQEQFESWLRLTDEMDAVDPTGTADAEQTSGATARRSSPEALAEMERARGGDTDAMLSLAARFESGNGVERHHMKSLYWLNQALSSAGDVEAMVWLGQYYEGRIGGNDSGRPRSIDRARALYRKAYELGSDEAGALLAELESRGKPGPRVPRPGRIDAAEAAQAQRAQPVQTPVAAPAAAPPVQAAEPDAPAEAVPDDPAVRMANRLRMDAERMAAARRAEAAAETAGQAEAEAATAAERQRRQQAQAERIERNRRRGEAARQRAREAAATPDAVADPAPAEQPQAAATEADADAAEAARIQSRLRAAKGATGQERVRLVEPDTPVRRRIAKVGEKLGRRVRFIAIERLRGGVIRGFVGSDANTIYIAVAPKQAEAASSERAAEMYYLQALLHENAHLELDADPELASRLDRIITDEMRMEFGSRFDLGETAERRREEVRVYTLTQDIVGSSGAADLLLGEGMFEAASARLKQLFAKALPFLPQARRKAMLAEIVRRRMSRAQQPEAAAPQAAAAEAPRPRTINPEGEFLPPDAEAINRLIEGGETVEVQAGDRVVVVGPGSAAQGIRVTQWSRGGRSVTVLLEGKAQTQVAGYRPRVRAAMPRARRRGSAPAPAAQPQATPPVAAAQVPDPAPAGATTGRQTIGGDTVRYSPDPTRPLNIASRASREINTPAGGPVLLEVNDPITNESASIVPYDGRVIVFVRIRDRVVPFYRSSEGTSGKTVGAWFPFAGISGSSLDEPLEVNDWIIKTSNLERGTGPFYGDPDIASARQWLNKRYGPEAILERTGDDAGSVFYLDIVNVMRKDLGLSGPDNSRTVIDRDGLKGVYDRAYGFVNSGALGYMPPSPVVVGTARNRVVFIPHISRSDAMKIAEELHSRLLSPVVDGGGSPMSRPQARGVPPRAQSGDAVQVVRATDEVDAIEPDVLKPGRERLGDKATLEVPEFGSVPVVYVAVEMDDIHPSHIPTDSAATPFLKNPRGDRNERPYHDPSAGRESRAKVVKIGERWSRSHIYSDSPTPTVGPPIVDSRGRVLGGNARTMGTMLAYRNDPAKVKEGAVSQAAKFGIDPEVVAGMRQPVLVRMIAGKQYDRGTLSRALNREEATAKTAETEAASVAASLSPDAQDVLAEIVASHDTIAKALSDPAAAPRIMQLLRSENVYTPDQLASLWNLEAGAFKPEGKLAVERMLLAMVVPNVSDVQNMDKAVANKMVKAMPHMLRARRHFGEAWTESVSAAVSGLALMEAQGISDVRFWLEQIGLQGAHPAQADPVAARLMENLRELGPNKFLDAMRQLSQSIQDQGQDAMFGEDLSPEQTIRNVFPSTHADMLERDGGLRFMRDRNSARDIKRINELKFGSWFWDQNGWRPIFHPGDDTELDTWGVMRYRVLSSQQVPRKYLRGTLELDYLLGAIHEVLIARSTDSDNYEDAAASMARALRSDLISYDNIVVSAKSMGYVPDEDAAALELEQEEDVDLVDVMEVLDEMEEGGPRFMRERTDTQLASDHVAAFDRGDVEQATGIVREYARRRGYETEAYHGTFYNFNEFSLYSAAGNDIGFHFGNRSAADNRINDLREQRPPAFVDPSGRVIPAQLRLQNPLRLEETRRNSWQMVDILNQIFEAETVPPEFEQDVDAYFDGALESTINGEVVAYRDMLPNRADENEWVGNYLRSKGFDGIVYDNRVEGGTSYIVFFPEQIKSAEPFTYDKDGELIPLDKRFDDSTGDIRFMRERSEAQLSADHAAAFDRGDVEQATAIVREYGRRKGYTIEAHHGLAQGRLDGNAFDPDLLGSNTGAPSARLAFFFAATRRTAKSYARSPGLYLADAIRKSISGAQKIIEMLSYAAQVAPEKLSYARDTNELENEHQRLYALINQFNLELNDFIRELRKGPDWKDSIESMKADQVVSDMFDTFKEMEQSLHKAKLQLQARSVSDPVRLGDEATQRAANRRGEIERAIEAWLTEFDVGKRRSVIQVLLSMRNPLWFDQLGRSKRIKTYRDIIVDAKTNGHDGVVIENTYDAGPLDTVYAVFSPSQIKSADPFTYDENGELIPLDKRFDDSTGDIRFMREQEPDAIAAIRDSSEAGSRTSDLATALFWRYSVLDKAVKAAKRRLDIETGDMANVLFQNAPGYRENLMTRFGADERKPFDDAATKLGKRLGLSKEQVLDRVQEHAFLRHALDVMAWLRERDAARIDRETRRRTEKLEAFGEEFSPEQVAEDVAEAMTSLGVTQDYATQRLEEIEAEFASDPAWGNLSDRLREMNRKTLEIGRQYGLITEAAYQELIKRYPNYVPVVKSLFRDGNEQQPENVRQTRARMLRRLSGASIARESERRLYWAASWDLTQADRMMAAHLASFAAADNAMYRLARAGSLEMEQGGKLIEVVDESELIKEQVKIQRALDSERVRQAARRAEEEGVEGEAVEPASDDAILEKAAGEVRRFIERQVSGTDRQKPTVRRFKADRDVDVTPPEAYAEIEAFEETGLTALQRQRNDEAAQRGVELPHKPLKIGTKAYADKLAALRKKIRIAPKGTVLHYRINDPVMAAAMLSDPKSFMEKWRGGDGKFRRMFALGWMKLMAYYRFAFVQASFGFWKGESFRSPKAAQIMTRVMSEELRLPKEVQQRIFDNLDRILAPKVLKRVMVWPLVGPFGALRSLPGRKPWRSVRHVMLGRAPRTAYEELVAQAMEDGVLQGSLYAVESHETMVADLRRRVDALSRGQQPGRTRMQAAKAVTDWISSSAEQVIGGIDMVNRMNVYQAAIEAGVDRPLAAVMAREATVDFGKKGTGTGWASNLYLFLNPRMQGIHQLIRAFKAGDGKGMARLTSSKSTRILFTVFKWQLALKLITEFFWEDDEDPRSELSQFAALQNMLVPLPFDNEKGQDLYFEINHPYGFGAVAKVANRLGEFLVGDSTPIDFVSGSVGDVASELTPLAFDATDPLSLIQAVTPTNAQVFIDLIMNRDWKGSPIYPKGAQFGPGDPRESQQYFAANTWRSTVWMADALANLTQPIRAAVGIPGQRGFEVSPNRIQYLIERNVPGVVRDVISGASALSGNEVTVDRLPVVGAFVTQSGNRGVLAGRWRDLARIDENLRADVREGRLPSSEIRERYGMVGRWLSSGRFRAASGEIRKLQEERNKAARAGRQDRVDKINERIESIQERVLREFGRARVRQTGGGLDMMFQRDVLGKGDR